MATTQTANGTTCTSSQPGMFGLLQGDCIGRVMRCPLIVYPQIQSSMLLCMLCVMGASKTSNIMLVREFAMI